MFDLPKAESIMALSLTQGILSTAISIVLVIAPISSSFATELQHATEIELTKQGSLRVLYQGTDSQAQSVAQKESDLVKLFALENQLNIEWISVEKDWQLISSLID